MPEPHSKAIIRPGGFEIRRKRKGSTYKTGDL